MLYLYNLHMECKFQHVSNTTKKDLVLQYRRAVGKKEEEVKFIMEPKKQCLRTVY